MNPCSLVLETNILTAELFSLNKMFYHLILEIKNRTFLIITTWVSVFFITYHYKETLLFNLIKSNSTINYFLITNVTEVFLTYFKLNQFLANYFLTLYICYQLFLFCINGLYYTEYLFLKNLFLLNFINLICLTLFLNFFGIPNIWTFFFKYQELISNTLIPLHFETKLLEFLAFYTYFFHLTILNAIFFTILIFFSVNTNKNLLLLKNNRKIFHLFLLIIIILVTPPDLFSFLLISFIWITSFELILFFNFLKI